MSDTRHIDPIIVGERRRRDMGDVDGLAASIAEIGLLHPIVINSQGELIAGERRLGAVQQLGWADVPVTVVDIVEMVRGEFVRGRRRRIQLAASATRAEAVSLHPPHSDGFTSKLRDAFGTTSVVKPMDYVTSVVGTTPGGEPMSTPSMRLWSWWMDSALRSRLRPLPPCKAGRVSTTLTSYGTIGSHRQGELVRSVISADRTVRWPEEPRTL